MKNSLLLRLLTVVLFLAVPILGVWTFVKAEDWGLWFPPNYSSFGVDIDHLFNVIMWMVAITFVGTEVALVWCILKYTSNRTDKGEYTHGNHKLELIWTVIPGIALIFIAISQMGTWTDIKIRMPNGPEDPYTPNSPIAEVYGSQFDWRFRYPDADGNFAGADVIESAYDFYVPLDTRVVFRLRSRDVLHSFFVPNLRLKQDAVPGMSIPVWFDCNRVGSYDIICAELCGWGHYKMAGRLHVLEQADYDAWLAGKRADLYSNGTDF